jgi:hypothetical protein
MSALVFQFSEIFGVVHDQKGWSTVPSFQSVVHASDSMNMLITGASLEYLADPAALMPKLCVTRYFLRCNNVVLQLGIKS